MIKLISLVQRKKRFSPKAFEHHWLKVHAPIAANIPGLLGFRINISLEPGDPIPEGYDGVAEMWFDNRKALRDALNSKEWDAVRADGARFVENSTEVITREHIIVPTFEKPKRKKKN